MNALRAEVAKLATLPSARAAGVVALALPATVAFLNARAGAGTGPDAGYSELAFGVVGAIVLGVVAVAGEYTDEGDESAGGRVITTSLAVLPSRLRLLVAKAAAVAGGVAVLAVVAAGATFAARHVALGDAASSPQVGRVAGVVVYWVLTALLGLGLTVLTRRGLVPLLVLVANSSVLSPSYLLSRVVPAAAYAPDLAGLRMFVGSTAFGRGVDPVTGGLVMAAWTLAVGLVAVVVFHRRDA